MNRSRTARLSHIAPLIALAGFSGILQQVVLAQGCPSGTPTVVVTAPINSQASNCLQTSGTVSVTGTSPVYFKAGSAIHLMPGFTAAAGSTGTAFVAVIAPVVTISSLPLGTYNSPYPTTTLAALEGSSSGPFVWSQSGLPAGLSLTSAGVLSGTPASAGSYNVTVTATDSTTGVSSLPAVLALNISLSVSPSSLSSGVKNTAYSQTLSVVGGTAPYTWSVTGTLPTGLSPITSSGVISGTPTATGTFPFVVHVVGSGSNPATADLSTSITIAPSASTTTLTSAGTSPSLWIYTAEFFATIAPSDATGTVTFTDTTTNTTLGTLPIGTGAQAVLYIQTLSVGSHSIVAAYSGDSNHAASTSSALPWNVSSSIVYPYPISYVLGPTASSFPVTVSQNFMVSPDLSFSQVSASIRSVTSLPTSAHNVTGYYCNIPTSTTCSISVPSIQVSGIGQTGQVTIPVSIPSSSQPSEAVMYDIQYSLTDGSVGGTYPYYPPYYYADLFVYVPASGALADFFVEPYSNLNIVQGGSATLAVPLQALAGMTGNLTSFDAETFTGSLNLGNSGIGYPILNGSTPAIGSKVQVPLSVGSAVPPATYPVTLRAYDSVPQLYGTSQSAAQYVKVVSSITPSFAVAGGTLPTIVVPSSTQHIPLSFQSLNNYSGAVSLSLLTSTQNSSCLSLSGYSITTSALNMSFSPASISITPASQGSTIATFTLPAFGDSSHSGLIASCNLAFTATDGTTTQQSIIPLLIVNATIPTVSTTTLPAGAVGAGYTSTTLTATAGTTPYVSWSLVPGSNPLPPGLSLSTSGSISGTISSSALVQTYTFSVQVTDSYGLTSLGKSLSIQVQPPPQSTTLTLTASPTNLTFGALTTLNATFTPSGVNPPVYLFDNGLRTLYSVTPGTPMLWLPSSGTHVISVSYSGSQQYAASTSSNITITVGIATPVISVTNDAGLSATNAPWGSPVTIRAGIIPGAATGYANFYDGSVWLGRAQIIGSYARFTTSSLSVGNHAIFASYEGDDNDNPVLATASSPFSITISPSVTLTNYTPHSPAGYYVGDSFGLNIHGAPNQPVNVGSVRYSDYRGVPAVTDSNGNFTTLGVWDKSVLQGNPTSIAESQLWSVGLLPYGAVPAQPSPFTFTISASTQTTVQLIDTTQSTSYQSQVAAATGPVSFAEGDSWTVAVSSPSNPGAAVTVNNSPVTCNNTSSNNADSNGLCVVSGNWVGYTASSITETWKVGSTQASPIMTFSVIGTASPVISPTLSSVSGLVNHTFSATPSVSGGTPQYSWSGTGFPSWLTGLNTSTGEVSGTPTAAGTYSFSLSLIDAQNLPSNLQTFFITISDADLPYVSTATLPGGMAGSSYAQTLVAAGGSGSNYHNWTVSPPGTLPGTLQLSSSTGVISGNLPSACPGTSCQFSITVQDSSSATSPPQPFSIVLVTPITEYIRLNGRVVAIEHSTH